MAYSDNFPAQRPVFQADFANGGRIDPRASYTRSTTGTFFGTEKVLSSENLLLQSQDFDTTWAVSGIGSPTGSQTAPDGTSTAWLLTCNSGTNTGPRIIQTYTATSSTEYTAVAHLKAGTASHGYLTIRTDAINQYVGVLLDFSAGTIAVTAAGMTSQSGTVTALGSGWFRVTVTATSSGSLGSPNVNIGVSDGTAIGLYGRVVWSPVGTETMYAWGAQLSTTGTKVYDSPTTTQIARSYQTKLQTAAINAARFEYSATDGQSAGTSLGILVEGSSTNLVTYSSDITQSFFTGFRSTRESNVGIAPDGTLTADLLREDSTATNSHGMLFGYNSGGTTPQTISVYAKAAGRNYLSFRFEPTNGVFGGDYVWFNLSTGAVGTTDSDITASIESCGNGWYRCIATRTALASGNGYVVFYLSDADNSINYSGNSYSGIMLWGCQAEANASHASSLISTSGATATRAAESLSMDLTQAGFNGGPVSIVGELAPIDASVTGSKRVFSLSNGSDSENIRVHLNNSRMYSVVRSGSSNTAVGYNSNTLNDGEAVKFGLAVDTDSLIASTSGFNSLGTTGATLPSQATRLGIAEGHSGGQTLNSHWKSVKVFSEPLSLTNLQALTS